MEKNYEILESDAAFSSQDGLFTREEMEALVASANETLLPERQISLSYVEQVAERVHNKTHGLDIPARNFAIKKAVQGHIDLMSNGITASAKENLDLLPPAHPLSASATWWDEQTLRDARAEWVAADVNIAEELRPVVASAYKQTEGTQERMHAEMRLIALTASGRLDGNVLAYNTPIVASAEIPEFTNEDLEFMQARSYAYDLLTKQEALTASAGVSIDPAGVAARMIYRGETAKRVLSTLARNENFRAAAQSLNSESSDLSPYAYAARQQFSNLFEAISSMPNAAKPVDIRAHAADFAAAYDETGALVAAITAGASSNYVAAQLANSEKWTTDVSNWIESSEDNAEFAAGYWSIMDLNYVDPAFATIEEVFPTSK